MRVTVGLDDAENALFAGIINKRPVPTVLGVLRCACGGDARLGAAQVSRAQKVSLCTLGIVLDRSWVELCESREED